MNRPHLYFRSIEILIEGFQSETLFHINWGGCVVAHLIAANSGFVMIPRWGGGGFVTVEWEKNGNLVPEAQYWDEVIEARSLLQRFMVWRKMGNQSYRIIQRYLKSTGYQRSELLQIVEAFDAHMPKSGNSTNILSGLKAAIIKLKEIHRVSEEDVQVIYKMQFLYEGKLLASLKDEVYNWLRLYEADRNFDYVSYITSRSASFNPRQIHNREWRKSGRFIVFAEAVNG